MTDSDVVLVDMDEQKEENREENDDEEGDDEEMDEEEEASDEMEDNEEEGKYIVEEIQDVRFYKGALEFLTKWKTSGEVTWEPYTSFPDGVNYSEIEIYKEKCPANMMKFKREYAKLQRKESQKRTSAERKQHRNWTYVAVDDDMYEKVDPTAKSRDVKGLKDPNRLKDKDEEFLNTYQDGTRLSRSKAREIKQNIKSPQKQPLAGTSVKEQDAAKPEKKKRGAGNGKKTAEDEPGTSSMTSENNQIVRKPRGRKKKEDGTEPVRAEEAHTEKLPKIPEGIQNWKRKKRDKKLNSSDSSSEDEEQQETSKLKPKSKTKSFSDLSDSSDDDTVSFSKKKRSKRARSSSSSSSENEKLAPKVKSARPSATKPPVTKRQAPKPEVSRPPAPKPVTSSSSSIVEEMPALRGSSTTLPMKRIPKKPRAPEPPKPAPSVRRSPSPVRILPIAGLNSSTFVKNPKIRYENEVDDEDHDSRPEVVHFGLQRFRGDNEQLLMKDMQNRRSKRIFKGLHLAIEKRHNDSVYMCLYESDPLKALASIRASKSEKGEYVENAIHKMLNKQYEAVQNGSLTPEHKNEELEKCSEVIKTVLNFVPINLLADQDYNGNTILHYAIFLRMVPLVSFLIEFGAPLHIRNKDGLTPVAAALPEYPIMLETAIKGGGTFHYLVKNIAPVYGEDLYYFRTIVGMRKAQYSVSLEKATSLYHSIDKCCRENRAQFNDGTIRETGYGPIVCMPIGKVPNVGTDHCEQFRYPNIERGWNTHTRFMVAVMQMMWNDTENKFVASKYAPRLKKLPQLSGIDCTPAFETNDLKNAYNSIYFHATRAVNNHIVIANYERNKAADKSLVAADIAEKAFMEEVKQIQAEKRAPKSDENPPDIKRPFNHEVFTVSISLESHQAFSFIACQLIKYEFIKPPNYAVNAPPTHSSEHPTPMFNRFNSGNSGNQPNRSNGRQWDPRFRSRQPLYHPQAPPQNSLLSPHNPIYQPVDPLQQDFNQPGLSSYNPQGPSTSSYRGPY